MKKVLSRLMFWRTRPPTTPEAVERRRGPRPERDWLFILFSFVVINVLLIGFNIILFQRVIRGEFFSAGTIEATSIKTIDRAKLKEVLDLFEERSKRFRELGGRPPDELVVPEVGTTTTATSTDGESVD